MSRWVRSACLLVMHGALMGCASATPFSAVTGDPPIDRQFPARMESVSIPAAGASMNGFFYLASGAGPHPIAVMLHGFPGYEQNRDLAQSLRRAGFNVLFFHYRGAWGSGGGFSFAGAIEDTLAAIAFARDPARAAELRADPSRLVLVGHSMGGFMALAAAARDPSLRAIALLSPWDLGRRGAEAKKSPTDHAECLESMAESLPPLAGATAEGLCQELELHAAAWTLASQARAVSASTLLTIGAREEGLEGRLEPLVRALSSAGAPLEKRLLQSDHGSSDQRIALQELVVRWAEQR